MTDFEKYVQRYVQMIPSDNWMEEMKIVGKQTVELFTELNEDSSLFKYAEDKWTLKELLMHLIDAEKIFQYRALRFARKDTTELPGYEEDDFVANSFANERQLASLVEEFTLVRRNSVLFFETLKKEAMDFTGVANGNSMSVSTIGQLIVGHTIHHLAVIRERYLPLLQN